MATMAELLARRGGGGWVDDKTLLLMAMLQGIGQLGKTASGISDWVMRSQEQARAKERYEYEKRRRPFDEAAFDLRMGIAKAEEERKKIKWDKESSLLDLETDVAKTKLEREKLMYEREPKPATPAQKMNAIVATIRANVEAKMANAMNTGTAADINAIYKEELPQMVLPAQQYVDDMLADTADLPPEQRMLERRRRGGKIFKSVVSNNDVMFPTIVGSVDDWSDFIDAMKKEGVQDLDSPEGLAALDKLWDEKPISAGILSAMIDEKKGLNREVYNKALMSLLTKVGTSPAVQLDFKKFAGDNPMAWTMEMVKMGYKPTLDDMQGKPGKTLDLIAQSQRGLMALQALQPEYKPPSAPLAASMQDLVSARPEMEPMYNMLLGGMRQRESQTEEELLRKYIEKTIGKKVLEGMKSEPIDVLKKKKQILWYEPEKPFKVEPSPFPWM